MRESIRAGLPKLLLLQHGLTVWFGVEIQFVEDPRGHRHGSKLYSWENSILRSNGPLCGINSSTVEIFSNFVFFVMSTPCGLRIYTHTKFGKLSHNFIDLRRPMDSPLGGQYFDGWNFLSFCVFRKKKINFFKKIKLFVQNAIERIKREQIQRGRKRLNLNVWVIIDWSKCVRRKRKISPFQVRKRLYAAHPLTSLIYCSLADYSNI